MNKTIKQWLSELPEPYRGKALANMKSKGTLLAHDLYDALNNAFCWEDTSEGNNYWKLIAEGNLPVVNTFSPPTCAIEALMTIALKKGFDVQDIMTIQLGDGDLSEWFYTLKDNTHVIRINLKPE